MSIAPPAAPTRRDRGQGTGASAASRLRGFRQQLAVYSPLPARALPGTAAGALFGRDPTVWLRDTLLREFDADDVLLCGSGTEALQLAIRAAREHIGGEPTVALPAFSCYDVGAAAVAADAPLALYDIDPETLAPDLPSLDHALGAGARVVVVSPLYGLPVDWESIEQRAAAFGAVVIEDAAQGQGATWRERPLGSLGKISVISFGRGKGWTGGGGGAVLFRRGFAARRAALEAPGALAGARTLLGALAQCALGQPAVYGIPASIPWLGLGETRYKPAREPGGLARASAALLARTRAEAQAEAERRRISARALRRAVPDSDCLRHVQPLPGGEPGWLRLPVRIRGGLSSLRNGREALRLGVTASYPSTLAALPVVRQRLSVSGGTFPGAESLVEELVTAPTHSRITSAEKRAVADLLQDCATIGLCSE